MAIRNFILIATDETNALRIVTKTGLSTADQTLLHSILARYFGSGDLFDHIVPPGARGHHAVMLQPDGTVKDSWGGYDRVIDDGGVKAVPADREGKPLVPKDNVSTLTQGEIARTKGYSGDVCDMCFQFTMKRVGTCLTCDSCGATTGCG